MSPSIGSHRWCQCLLCLLSSRLRDITPGYHVDPGLMSGSYSYRVRASFKTNLFGHRKQWWCHWQFGPLCEVWCRGVWLSSLNSIPKPSHCKFLTVSTKFPLGSTEILLPLQEFLPHACSPGVKNKLLFSWNLHVAARWQLTWSD